MKRIIVTVLIMALFSTAVFAEKRECEICSALLQAGFPEEYRESLCALQLRHPSWRFEPLFITALSEEKGEKYTFPYVVTKECVQGRSLVSAGEKFAAYRDGEAVFDTGYFDATRDAVAYFMDPRNFLSEKGVFQFLRLTGDGGSAEGVERMLSGSAPSQTEGIGEILLRVGEKTGLCPLFLASRLRQEQGADGSPLLWGTAGSTLLGWYEKGVQDENGRWVAAPSKGYDKGELESLDGIYNPFHAETSGQGAFAVYLAGARHGKTMGWTTLEAGLLGGAEKIRDEYVGRYQDTLYLQKWNVDIRSAEPSGQSRNFWGQYMQNIGGAKTEADRLYESYKGALLLEEALSFSIPVYGKMPVSCPDPAGGACEVFASEKGAKSEHLYLKEVLSPEPVTSSKNPPITEKKEPVLYLAYGFGIMGIVLTAVGLIGVRKGKKQGNLGIFTKKNKKE